MTIDEIEARMSEIEVAKTAEDADLDALIEEVRSLNEAKAEIRAKAKAEAEERLKVAEMNEPVIEEVMEERKMDAKEIRNSAEYVEAFANYIKTGKDNECRALISENGTNGTVPVPELVYDIVKTAWEKEGIMARVKKAFIKGNLKVGFEISATGASVHTEGGEKPDEETLVLGVVELVPASIKKWIHITDEVLDLRGDAFLQYVYEELAYQIAKKAGEELIDKIKACGTASTTTCPAVAVLAEQTIAMGTIAKAVAKLSDEAQNPCIIMNKATYADFKAVQYANGYGADPFEGLPVVFNNHITAKALATTGVTYAIVGDLGYGALANFPNGEEINFKFDELSEAEKDLVKVVGREYVGLGVVAPNAFVQIQGA